MNLFSANKRLPAFTLLELLVGMIVCGIVLTAIWTAFHIIVKLSVTATENDASNEEVSFFHQCLIADFHTAPEVTRRENILCFKQNPESEDSLVYYFENRYVLRKSEDRTDIFHVNVILQNAWPDSNVFQCTIGQAETQEGITLWSAPSASEKMEDHD